jgi:alpha-D-ribose 1-methylphosphonate 5-triphosphate synthase subunit PhnH
MPDVNPETQHERTDVNVRALLLFLAIFAVFGLLTHIILWVMFRQFAAHVRHTQTAALTDVARPANASVPQQPRLQPFPTAEPTGQTLPPNSSTPVVDMERMRAGEEQQLNNPGWVDKQKGIVRLPINVAKQLAVQRLNAGAHP